jgi:hypothetical protein
LHARLDATGRHALYRDGIVEQGVMEGHLSSDHRNQGIMGQHDSIAGTAKSYSDCGSDLIGAEDHGESKRKVGPHARHCSVSRFRPGKQEPGRAREAGNATDYQA